MPFPDAATAAGRKGAAAESDSATTGIDEGQALSQCRRLARVLTVTQEMLDLADAGEWDSVAEREADRREDIKHCFGEAVEPRNAELVAEALAAVLHLNEELMARLASARESVLQQGIAQARTRSAIDSYHDVKRGP
ncbi:MAG: flagellar protein FliT [Chromatocurvus sp.]